MIQLTGAGKRYGPRILFENAGWLVTPNDRTGIVGANGTGKSSILKVLAGIEGLDSGTIAVQKSVDIGYLPQEGLSLSGRTVFAECMTVFAGLRALEEEQEDLARRRQAVGPLPIRLAWSRFRRILLCALCLRFRGFADCVHVGDILRASCRQLRCH